MSRTAAIVDQHILDGQPIKAISYLEPEESWDSGFCLFAGQPDRDSETALVCLHCLIDEHPEAGEGMDLARQHGEAVYYGTDWTTAAVRTPWS